MNWLAHTFLSEPNVQFQLGNLLADLVRGPERESMSADFRRGADCHKIIDAFTDSHPLVRRSRAQVPAEYRRFSGVLIDVFYDYLLAKHWHSYASQSLAEFTQRFYAQVQGQEGDLPEPAKATMGRIVRHDLLGSYRQIGGVEHALRRISAYLASRWQKPFALERSVPSLLRAESALDADFVEFFPQLQNRVADWLSAVDR
jgi:acyl carrier protein phosphodiesterase